MQKKYFFFLLSLTSLFAESKNSFNLQLSRELALKSSLQEQSILIQRVADEKILFAHNPDLALRPASLTKLLTSAAALKHWGPHHRFETKIFYTGQFKKGIITGDLLLLGSGDPWLITEKLWQLASDLYHLGLRKIKGHLIIDTHLFDQNLRDGSRKTKSKFSSHAYDAPVSAFGVNFNTVAVAIAPGEKIGLKARVSLDPLPLNGVEIENQTKTVGPAKKAPKLVVLRKNLPKGRLRIIVRGQVPSNAKLAKVYRSVVDPIQTGGAYLKAFLASSGITLQGQVKEVAELAKQKTLLFTYEGESLSQIVRGLNFFSNNYIADVLVKRLGLEFFSPTKTNKTPVGAYKEGLSYLKDFLFKLGDKTKNISLKNGSGLSSENKLSARHMVSILNTMAKDLSLYPEFAASLPSSGQTGTLKERFQQERFKGLVGKVRAKTGTLSSPVSVSALAGYLNHPQHKLISFAIIQNGLSKKTQPNLLDLQESQEKALALVLKSKY